MFLIWWGAGFFLVLLQFGLVFFHAAVLFFCSAMGRFFSCCNLPLLLLLTAELGACVLLRFYTCPWSLSLYCSLSHFGTSCAMIVFLASVCYRCLLGAWL
jgi:hypothetical protein